MQKLMIEQDLHLFIGHTGNIRAVNNNQEVVRYIHLIQVSDLDAFRKAQLPVFLFALITLKESNADSGVEDPSQIRPFIHNPVRNVGNFFRLPCCFNHKNSLCTKKDPAAVRALTGEKTKRETANQLEGVGLYRLLSY